MTLSRILKKERVHFLTESVTVGIARQSQHTKTNGGFHDNLGGGENY